MIHSPQRRMLAMLFIALISTIVSPHAFSMQSSADLIPAPDLSNLESQVAKKVELHRKAVERRPDQAEPWGRYGMVLDAHSMAADARAAYRTASLLAPQDFRWVYLYGILCMRTSPEEARLAFEKARQLDAAYPPLHVWLAEVLDMLGESDAAWESYKEAARLAPNNPWMRLSLGRAALDRNRLEIARTELLAADAIAPDTGMTLSLLSKLFYRLGDEATARKYGERAGDHMNKILVDDPILRRVMEEGVSMAMFAHRATIYRDAGRLEDAISECRRGLQHSPTDVNLLIGLIETLARAKKYQESLNEADRAIAAGIQSTQIERSRAMTLFQLGRHAEAEKCAQDILTVHPNDPRMLQVIAYVASVRGETNRAIELLVRSLELEPTDKDARLGLARVMNQAGRFTEALAELEQLEVRMEKDANFQRTLGFAQLGLRRYEQAEQALLYARQHLRNDGPLVRGLASAYTGLQEYEKAINTLREFLNQNQEALLVANELAWLLATCPRDELRNGKEALALAQRIAQNPSLRSASVLSTQAAALAEVGRFDEATTTMFEAIELLKSHPSTDTQREQFQTRLDLYRAKKPYRASHEVKAPS